jgi:hypothetical protein
MYKISEHGKLWGACLNHDLEKLKELPLMIYGFSYGLENAFRSANIDIIDYMLNMYKIYINKELIQRCGLQLGFGNPHKIYSVYKNIINYEDVMLGACIANNLSFFKTRINNTKDEMYLKQALKYKSWKVCEYLIKMGQLTFSTDFFKGNKINTESCFFNYLSYNLLLNIKRFRLKRVISRGISPV